MTRQRRTGIDRFWEKVITGPRPQDCWIWVGAIANDGYGRFWVSRDGGHRAVRPRRYAYEHLTGETLDPGIALMHVCDVPLCVHATTDADSHLVPGCSGIEHARSGHGRDVTRTPPLSGGGVWVAPSSTPTSSNCAQPSSSTDGTKRSSGLCSPV